MLGLGARGQVLRVALLGTTCAVMTPSAHAFIATQALSMPGLWAPPRHGLLRRSGSDLQHPGVRRGRGSTARLLRCCGNTGTPGPILSAQLRAEAAAKASAAQEEERRSREAAASAARLRAEAASLLKAADEEFEREQEAAAAAVADAAESAARPETWRPQLARPLLVLVGSPGAGKRSLGRLVAQRFNASFVDTSTMTPASSAAVIAALSASSTSEGSWSTPPAQARGVAAVVACAAFSFADSHGAAEDACGAQTAAVREALAAARGQGHLVVLVTRAPGAVGMSMRGMA